MLGLLVSVVPPIAFEPLGALAQAVAPRIPETFSGSLTAQQHQSASVTEDGSLSAYDARARFDDLVFGRGREGPFTLLRAHVSYSGFEVTQSVLAPDGTCTATYLFGLDRTKSVFGDLGGFSRSLGRWRVGIELSVHVTGTIVSSSGCGPNDEFTKNVFGEPPTITVPLRTTGNFEPSTGIISIDTSTNSSYARATQTDDVIGQLNGGLQIYLAEYGHNENVTGITSTVVVGQPIRLQARFGDGSSPDLSGAGWVGTTRATAVGSYTFQDVHGKTTFLDRRDLTDPDLVFYWVAGSTAGTAYRISVTGTNRRTGAKETAETTFYVVAPDVLQFSATTCGFGVNRTLTGPTFSPPEMILGYNDTSRGCHETPGIQWNIDVAAPSTAVGDIGMTQTVTSTIRHDNRPCAFGGLRLDGSRTLADNGTLLYGSQSLAAGSHWIPSPQLEDSPSVPLSGGGTWHVLETFTDYVMFQPAANGSIWVAIEQLRWTFSGTADFVRGQWTLSNVHDPDNVISSIPATGQPEWTGTIMSGPFGSC